MSPVDQSTRKVYSETWKKPPFISSPLLRWLAWLAVAVYLTVALGTLEVNWQRVADGVPRGQKFLAAFFPPDFASRWDSIVDGILESVWMAIISTVAGIALSIPLALVLREICHQNRFIICAARSLRSHGPSPRSSSPSSPSNCLASAHSQASLHCQLRRSVFTESFWQKTLRI